MTRTEVLDLLEISTLNSEIADNVLELCEIRQISEDVYDAEEVCRVYAETETFFKEYLPEFYVCKILNVDADELLKINIEHIPMPAEMQCVFYDRYPIGEFRYSKYVYKSIQVYKVLGVLSKSIYLEIPDTYAISFETSFVTAETAATALGFKKINPALYHYYLMKLDIRFASLGNIKKYLTDDISNTIEKAQEVFEKYLPFYEACETYGYNLVRLICNEYSLLGFSNLEKTGDLLKYDVVYSDKRYKFSFKDSASFLDKNDFHQLYYKWFLRNTKSIKYRLKVLNVEESKFQCDLISFSEIEVSQNYIEIEHPFTSSVIDSSFSPDKGLSIYEYDPEYENLDLLYKVWGLDGLENKYQLEKELRQHKFNCNIKSSNLFSTYVFAEEYKKAVYFITAKKLGLILENENYFNSIFTYTLINHYMQKGYPLLLNWSTHIVYKSKNYISINISKYLDRVIDYKYKQCQDNILFQNQKFISYEEHKKQCYKIFYTQKVHELYSKDSGYTRMKGNLDISCPFNTNSDLQKAINDDLRIAFFIKDDYQSDTISVSLKCKKISTITEGIPSKSTKEYWPIMRVISYLNIDKYSLTLIWAILFNLELRIIYDNGLYIEANEVINLKKYVNGLLDEYTPVSNLYYLLHKCHPICKICDDIIEPASMLYFLMPENNKGFFLIKKISLDIIDKIYNEKVNCDTLLTAAEIEKKLSTLPSKIPSTLAIRLLNINNNLKRLDQKYSLYIDSSGDYCRRDAILKLQELQNLHCNEYVLEENIPTFLNNNMDSLSENDIELLKTISVYNAPDYIMLMSENKEISNDRAYLKEDILRLKDYFHRSINGKYNVSVDKNVTCNKPYQTYILRENPLGLRETIRKMSPKTADIWDHYVMLQLSSQQRADKSLDSLIYQYIKSLNIVICILKDYGISEVSDLQTSMINRYFQTIDSTTYCNILIEFFKYAIIMYADFKIKPQYRIKELKLPKAKRKSPMDILPETYSFMEYSKLFNYCNDYYTHIDIAVNEILEKGTCIYASTWFYVMSHLNNTWRSNDFAMFPYVDILDIIYRNNSGDFKWYINNRIVKSEAIIIALRIQNNPKVISKTKKYTRFMCSNELLETFITIYSLLALYTSRFLSYDTGFVNHFENRYNGVNKSQLNFFFDKFGMVNFKFKSKKMNKTLLSMIDYLENYYIVNNIDTERRQAMLLRSHVNSSSTSHYIVRKKEAFDRLTNMICARGEFGYAYEMMVRSIINSEDKLSTEEMTDKIRKIRFLIPNMKDMDVLYGFLNYTHKEQESLNEFINSLSIEEFQTTLTKLYLNHLGSKTDKNLSCIKKTCQSSQANKDDCTYCIFHIPSIYSLSIICQSISEDIYSYKNATRDITRKKIITKILKKSRDIIWARQKYGDEILQECLSICGADYEQFLTILNNFLKTNNKIYKIAGEKYE